MSGIYIHVPFCWQRCHYCDFYSTLNLNKRKEFSEKIILEIRSRSSFISDSEVNTIYFGGGTPSLMDTGDIAGIISEIKTVFNLSPDHEITLEANPDDIGMKYLEGIQKAGVNRLSIGIQSFDDKDLELMNRRHNSVGAVNSVRDAYRSGFENISIDLIYGLPGQDMEAWLVNLEKAVEMRPEHISSYNLTYEKGTNFYRWLKEGKLKETDDESSLWMFRKSVEFLEKEGYEHYEISNYAREGKYSRHNTKYWFGEQYLGLGPSAHSYNGKTRCWNISSLRKWLESDIGSAGSISLEEIDSQTARNEMIMTRLRTKWGIPGEEYVEKFGSKSWDELLLMAKSFLSRGLMEKTTTGLAITEKGKFLSDGIISDLFVLE
jgi:oxygen-independent coproporphyrinogen-3 oxidase